MENLISKELLSEVLGYKIWIVLDCSMVGTLRYCIYPNKGDEPSKYMFPINIHELAFRTRDYFKTKNKHLSLNQSIEDIFKEANSIYI